MMTRSLLAVGLMLVAAVKGQFPAIDDGEGFEVDMEPFYLEFNDFDEGLTGVPEYWETWMQQGMVGELPNLVAVILQHYPNENGTKSFYTGSAVFQGPPYRSNHDVYQAQDDALLALDQNPHVSVNASLGVPSWFTPAETGEHNVVITETALDQGTAIEEGFVKTEETSPLGAALWGSLGGCVFGVSVILAILYFRRASTSGTNDSLSLKQTFSTNASDSFDEEQQESSDESDELQEQFYDEEEQEQRPLSKTPLKNNKNISNLDFEPPLASMKRSPARHSHRRWKSTSIGGGMLDTIVDDDSPSSISSNHRRSSSFAHESVVHAERRPSMAELLGSIDMDTLEDDL